MATRFRFSQASLTVGSKSPILNPNFASRRPDYQRLFSHWFSGAQLLAVGRWLRPNFNENYENDGLSNNVLANQTNIKNTQNKQPAYAINLAAVKEFSLVTSGECSKPFFSVSSLPLSVYAKFEKQPERLMSPLKTIKVNVILKIQREGEHCYLLQHVDWTRVYPILSSFDVQHGQYGREIAQQIGRMVSHEGFEDGGEPEPIAITLHAQGHMQRYVLHYLVHVSGPPRNYEVLVSPKYDLLANAILELSRPPLVIAPDDLASFFCMGCMAPNWVELIGEKP